MSFVYFVFSMDTRKASFCIYFWIKFYGADFFLLFVGLNLTMEAALESDSRNKRENVRG